jgi:tRNA(Ile)-lysidine synthase
MILTRVKENLQIECRLPFTRSVLVGVSGGPDSLCLIDVLHRLEIPVVVAHFNHKLRPDAHTDCNFVQDFAEGRGLPFIKAEGNVAGFAEDQGLSLEEAARILRYRFLFAAARERHLHAVMMGHHADDQVETVLMHLLRGAGLAGLKGMQFSALPNEWSDTIPLVRPLLNIWREEIDHYLNHRDLQPVVDRSNWDVTIFRNRLRHELIPYLESYNPAIKQVIWRMARILEGDDQILEERIVQVWRNCLVEQNDYYVALDAHAIKELPVGLQRHVLRRALSILRPGLRDINFESVERALQFVARPPVSQQQDLSTGLRLLLEGKRLWLASWEADLPNQHWPQMLDNSARRLIIPGQVQLSEDWRLQAHWVKDIERARSQAQMNTNPYQVWLDNDRLSGALQVRTRRPGDRFQPFGLGGHSMKLADFMVNVKLPRRARDRWPIICVGDDIVWVPGYRLGHPFRLTNDTSKAIFISLQGRALDKETA